MKRFLKNSRIIALMLSIALLAVVADVHAGRKSRGDRAVWRGLYANLFNSSASLFKPI